MVKSNALSFVMRALLGEQRADLSCVGATVTPPQFLNIQLVTNSLCKRVGILKSALIAQTALLYPYFNYNSFFYTVNTNYKYRTYVK